MPFVSPNTFDQHFDIAVLFNVVEESGKHVFEDNNLPPHPTALRKRVLSYVTGGYTIFGENIVVETSEMTHSNRI